MMNCDTILEVDLDLCLLHLLNLPRKIHTQACCQTWKHFRTQHRSLQACILILWCSTESEQCHSRNSNTPTCWSKTVSWALKTHGSNTVRKFFRCFPLVNNWLYIVQHSYNEIPGHQRRYTCFHNFRGAMVHESTDWKWKLVSSNPKKQGKDAVIFHPVWNPPNTHRNKGEWRQALIHGSHF